MQINAAKKTMVDQKKPPKTKKVHVDSSENYTNRTLGYHQVLCVCVCVCV